MPIRKFHLYQAAVDPQWRHNLGRANSLTSEEWAHKRIQIPSAVFADLRLMLRSLSRPFAHESHTWSRPIAMLIPRAPTCIAYSDAAHTGLGGWCKEFSFVWPLTRNDMVFAGFPMKELDDNFQELNRWTPKEQLPEGHDNLLHINPLEFLGHQRLAVLIFHQATSTQQRRPSRACPG